MAVGVRWVGWAAGIGLCVAGLVGCPTSTDCADPRNAEICGKEKVEVLVTVSAPVARMRAGEKAELTATLERKGEWPSQGEVTLSAKDLVGGVTMEPVQVAADATEATLEFVADQAVPQGAFPFTLVATPVDDRIPPAEEPLDAVVPGPPGTLDLSFGGDGKMTIQDQGTYDWAAGLAIDDRRRIMLAGYERPAGAIEDERPLLLRLDSHGAVDTDFAQSVASVASDRPWTHYADVLWTEEGIVIIAWQRAPDLSTDMTLLRLNDTGSLDSGFAQDKVQRVQGIIKSEGSYYEGVFLRLLLEGSRLWAIGSKHLLLYSHDGELNGEFGDNGVLPLLPRQIYPPIVLPNDGLVWIGEPPNPEASPSAWMVSTDGKKEQLLEGYLADLLSGEELISGHSAKVNACARRSATSTLCVGSFYHPVPGTLGGNGGFIVSLDANWNLDTAFGTGGFVLRFPSEDVLGNWNSDILPGPVKASSSG